MAISCHRIVYLSKQLFPAAALAPTKRPRFCPPGMSMVLVCSLEEGVTLTLWASFVRVLASGESLECLEASILQCKLLPTTNVQYVLSENVNNGLPYYGAFCPYLFSLRFLLLSVEGVQCS